MANVQGRVAFSDDQYHYLEVDKQSACGQCQQKGSCALNWQTQAKTHQLQLPKSQFQNPPEKWVNLECDDRQLLHYISILFLPGILLLLSAAGLDQYFANTMAVVSSFNSALLSAAIYGLALFSAYMISYSLLTSSKWNQIIQVVGVGTESE